MSTNERQRLKEHFFSCINLHRDEAQQHLESLRLEEPGLYPQLKTLLESHWNSDGFLNEQKEEEPNLQETKGLEGFILKRLIAKGGMGTVYLVMDREKSLYALKTMNRSLLLGHLPNRFAVEIKSLSKLSHPGIAKYYGTGHLKNQVPYLLMEYVPGLTMRKALTSLKLSQDQLINTFTQICEAASYAHKNGLIHRDLNPGNIMIQQNPKLQVKLIDFGIVKQQNVESAMALTGTGTIVGTPPFLAPEQLDASYGSIAPQTDIFNIGLICGLLFKRPLPYQLLETDSLNAYTEKIGQRSRLPTTRSLNQDPVIQLIEKACARNPLDRYAHVKDLLLDFEKIDPRSIFIPNQ